MAKSYSGDLRERVVEAVEAGASRHEAAERFEISVSSAVRWVQRWDSIGSCAAKPRGGSVSPLERWAEDILALVAAQPDLTLDETVGELLKRRIRTSKSALSRFFQRHDITLKKKFCGRRNSIAQTSPGRAGVGFESKACLIPSGWSLSMRLRSLPIWCGSMVAVREASI